MPTIIPKSYYCPKCKKACKGKTCDCGSAAKPVPPYTVRFRWIGPNGIEEHKRLTGTPPWMTKTAAQKGYEEWIAANPSRPKSELHTFDFMPLYEEYKASLRANVKESSYITFIQRLDRYVLPSFKNKKVTEITPADIRKWQDGLTLAGLSVGYKNAIRGAFNNFFAYLKIYDIPNPLSKVKAYKAADNPRSSINFWTEDEFKQFLSTASDVKYKTFFAFLYLTGCRKSEALALRWSDIEGDTVRFEKTVTQKTLDGRRKTTAPKTANSVRIVRMPQTLCALLDEYRATVPHAPADHVFGGEAPFSYNAIDNAFKKYIRASGVKPIRIHDLRHSHASLLINKGDNALSTLYVIAARLGDTVEMVLKTYGHLFPSNEDALLQKLEIDFTET